MKRNKNKVQNVEQRLCHLPNPMHLDACIQGGHIQQSKKVYSRKGKNKYFYKGE